jgi:hypothetical protein
VEVRAANELEQEFIWLFMLAYEAMSAEAGLLVGLTLKNVPYKPAIAIEFEVEQIFEQTPKIGTGKLLTST